MNKKEINNILFWGCLVLICILFLLFIYNVLNEEYFDWGSHQKNKLKKKTLFKRNPKCNNNQPLKDVNGELFEIYNDYSDMREFNKNIQNNADYRDKHQTEKAIGPKNIFVFRHAQRTQPEYYLNSNGIYKSTQIPKVINALNNKGYPIDAIVTVNPAAKNNAIHIQQTITLSSWLLNIPLYIYGTKYDTKETIKTIYSTNNFNNLNIIYVSDHACVQSLIENIIEIGSKTKNLKNYNFNNYLGNSKLPYWHHNNYQSIYHIDNKLKLHILNEGIETCEKGTLDITWGKRQACG